MHKHGLYHHGPMCKGSCSFLTKHGLCYFCKYSQTYKRTGDIWFQIKHEPPPLLALQCFKTSVAHLHLFNSFTWHLHDILVQHSLMTKSVLSDSGCATRVCNRASMKAGQQTELTSHQQLLSDSLYSGDKESTRLRQTEAHLWAFIKVAWYWCHCQHL